MSASLEEIRAALKWTPGIDSRLVERRAKAVQDLLIATGLNQFKIEQAVGIPLRGTNKRFPLVHYTFGDRMRRSVDNAHDPFAVKRAIAEMDGTGLDREDIQYFAKVCEIGQSCIPHLWPCHPTILDGLTTPDRHLDTLNEVWWLARWSGIDWAKSRNECPLRSAETTSRFREKTVDWRLQTSDNWVVNVEVKNFVRAHADRTYGKNPSFYRPNGYSHDQVFDSDDPRLKFPRSSDREINVLAVTRHDEIGSEFESWIEDYLDASTFLSAEDRAELADKIDAVVVWSRTDSRRGGWRRFYPRFRDIAVKREALNRLLVEPDQEDRNRPFVQRYTRSLPDVIAELDTVIS